MDRELYEKAEALRQEWLAFPALDEEMRRELLGLEGREEEITDRFWRPLNFGTGGLRGVLGAGTNRMNLYTVRNATQGLSDVLCRRSLQERGVVIGYDSRKNSALFAKETALVLCANGIKARLFGRLCPVPEVSFAIRHFNAAAGVMITASHNPREYNGYKVYWADGCQITPPVDADILESVRAVSGLDGARRMEEKEALEKGLLCPVPDAFEDIYLEAVLTQSFFSETERHEEKDLTVVYTPLNGTGERPVRRLLQKTGFSKVFVVSEQELPDGNFPTLPKPNPEEADAFALALSLAEEKGAELVLATDPDADRLGVCVKRREGGYLPLTGNMTGVLLADYVLTRARETGRLPANPVLCSTIVSTDMARAVAAAHGVSYVETLTGFKYIGEQIRLYEEQKIGPAELAALPNAVPAASLDPDEPLSFVFGLEESYGCLSGSYARDKDACGAVLLLCEAAVFWRRRGRTLWEVLLDLYEKYGFYREGQQSFEKKGPEGASQMKAAVNALRNHPPEAVGPWRVLAVRDYLSGIRRDCLSGAETFVGLPASDVIYFELDRDAWVCLRPSGTEPKLKLYMGVREHSREESGRRLEALSEAFLELLSGRFSKSSV